MIKCINDQQWKTCQGRTENSSFVFIYTYFQWTEDGQSFQIQYLTIDT